MPFHVIDLSRPLGPEASTFPGSPPPGLLAGARIEVDGYRELRLSLQTHSGTHMDAPSHILADGRSLDQIPLDRFIGRALTADLRGLPEARIPPSALEPLEREIRSSRFLLLRTGWGTHWGKPRYQRDFPSLTPEAALYLSRFPLYGIGVDTLSIDPVDSGDFPAHRALLAREILVVENLANLDLLPPGPFTFCAFPLPLPGADGSPVRAVALLG